MIGIVTEKRIISTYPFFNNNNNNYNVLGGAVQS